MQIAALAIYPVKGLRGLTLDHARLERQGLEHDRRWAVLRPDGRALTQRDTPAMARITAVPHGSGLVLDGAVEARATGTATRAIIWGTAVPAVEADPGASAWLTEAIGTPCTLVHLADPAARAVTPDLARAGDVVSLADGFPLLVTTTGSLAAVNGRLAAPLPMERFRPNLVLEHAEAWAEDGWAHLETPGGRLRIASPCVRCTVTTLDQRTGEATPRKEPLRTLGLMHRGADGAITFGINAIPERLGILRVGDVVTATLHS